MNILKIDKKKFNKIIHLSLLKKHWGKQKMFYCT